jgi:hypothetical protein
MQIHLSLETPDNALFHRQVAQDVSQRISICCQLHMLSAWLLLMDMSDFPLSGMF